MSWILNDIQSLLPFTGAPTAQEAPSVGARAPAFAAAVEKSPRVLIFVRHLGCPFCEQEIREAAELASKHPNVTLIVVTHATDADNATYIQQTLKLNLPSNMRLEADPSRTLYAKFGIGELSLGQIFDLSLMGKVKELRERGIKNTLTIGNRYQNSGAFAIAADGTVKWRHIAANAADTSDLAAAFAALS